MRFEHETREGAQQKAAATAISLRALQDEGRIDMLGPSEAFLEKAKGIFRWDLLIKAKEIQELQRALIRAKELSLERKWPFLVDVDPYGIG